MVSYQQEMLDIFILPNVGLEISTEYPEEDGAAGRFAVTGPARKLDILKTVAKGVDDDGTIDGDISPRSPVTLPLEIKREAGIPEASTWFAFIYPLSYFKSRLHRINLATDPWGFVHLLGGFAYFDDDYNLLGVNALTIVPSPTVLHLIGPFEPLKPACEQMHRLGRMKEVVIEGLRSQGFDSIGWVHPGEPPGGQPLSTETENHHGGFLLGLTDGDPVFYTINPVVPDDCDDFDLNGRFGQALVGLRIMLIEDDRMMRHNSNRRSARITFIHICVEAVVVLAIYLAVGSIVLHFAEGWAFEDGIYFCVVTMSTVGYGDIHPTRQLVWGFNLILIFAGVLLLFPRLAAVVSQCTSGYVAWGRRKLNDWFPNDIGDAAEAMVKQKKSFKKGLKDSFKRIKGHKETSSHVTMALDTARRRGSYLNRDGMWQAQSPLIFFSKNLVPTLFLFLSVQSISAGIFCFVEAWDFFTAFYHCLVTASTVGYGYPLLGQNADVSLLASRMWASVHILLSVALLGDAIGTFDDLRDERKKEVKRIEALNRKLDQALLDNLNMRASALRPEVARDAEGLTELEFVLGMCVELDMVDMDQITPFINKFRDLDVDGNGRLGMADLRLQTARTKTMTAVTELAWQAAVNRQATHRKQLSLETNVRGGASSRLLKSKSKQKLPMLSRWQTATARVLSNPVGLHDDAAAPTDPPAAGGRNLKTIGSRIRLVTTLTKSSPRTPGKPLGIGPLGAGHGEGTHARPSCLREGARPPSGNKRDRVDAPWCAESGEALTGTASSKVLDFVYDEEAAVPTPATTPRVVHVEEDGGDGGADAIDAVEEFTQPT